AARAAGAKRRMPQPTSVATKRLSERSSAPNTSGAPGAREPTPRRPGCVPRRRKRGATRRRTADAPRILGRQLRQLGVEIVGQLEIAPRQRVIPSGGEVEAALGAAGEVGVGAVGVRVALDPRDQ